MRRRLAALLLLRRERKSLKDRTALDKLVLAARLFPLVGKDPPPPAP